MIKSIKVKTSKRVTKEQLTNSIFPIEELVHQQNKLETIALTTTAIENTLLNNMSDYIYSTHSLVDKEFTDTLEVLLFGKSAFSDLIKALKDGDVAAKKRILKQLEEL